MHMGCAHVTDTIQFASLGLRGDAAGRRKQQTHQLPAGFLLSFLNSLQLIVVADVPVQCAHHNHGHHTRQEQDNHEGVDDGEPVDLVICHQQVGVPPGCPPSLTWLHLHTQLVQHVTQLWQANLPAQSYIEQDFLQVTGSQHPLRMTGGISMDRQLHCSVTAYCAWQHLTKTNTQQKGHTCSIPMHTLLCD